MKILASLLFIAAMTSFSAHAETGYLIELKNGRTIFAEHYWEENGQIRFTQNGGIMGFPMSMVEEIREGEAPHSATGTEVKKIENGIKEELVHNSANNSMEDVEEIILQYQELLKNIVKKTKDYENLYELARNRSDESMMKEIHNKIMLLNKEKYHLSQKVFEIYKDGFPEWWIVIMENK